jgi:hypothetical protein
VDEIQLATLCGHPVSDRVNDGVWLLPLLLTFKHAAASTTVATAPAVHAVMCAVMYQSCRSSCHDAKSDKQNVEMVLLQKVAEAPQMWQPI